MERVSDLILRDVRSGSFLKKNRLFEDTDFSSVKRNIHEIDKVYPNYPGQAYRDNQINNAGENESSSHVPPSIQSYNEGDLSFAKIDSLNINDAKPSHENIHMVSGSGPKPIFNSFNVHSNEESQDPRRNQSEQMNQNSGKNSIRNNYIL